METFYIAHSPRSLCNESFLIGPFLQSFQETFLTHKPTSILVISAHWETSEPTVNAISGTLDTLYDFDGLLPKELYELKYLAPGAPNLARRVQELLLGHGFPEVNVDEKRGLDHGAWVPLIVMYPEADIPVCQLSVVPNKDTTYHYNLGKALAPLKNEGVLIIGSGAATNNPSTRRLGSSSIAPWAQEFESWLEDALVSGRLEDVIDFEEKGPNAKLAHSTPEHMYPLFVAIGAAGEDAKSELIHQSWNGYTISSTSYKFTTSSKIN